jgi:hypothetical protein
MEAAMQENKKVLLKVPEFARRADMSPSRAYQGVATGEIPHVRIGGMLRIPAAFLDDLANRALAPEAEDDAR